MSEQLYDHIHPEFRHIACLSMEERLEFLDQPRWIGYQAAQQILDTLQGLMRKPKQPRMPNLLIVGVSSPEIGLHLFLLKRPVHRIGRFVFQGKMWSPCVIGLHGLIDHLLGFRKVFGARQQ